MDCKRFFVTGPPRTGKSTLMERLLHEAEKQGLRVEGFFTPEVTQGGRRIGFDIQVIRGPRVPLARRKPLGDENLRFAGYYLNPGASEVFSKLLPRSPNPGTLLVLDEIGPMELYVPGGKEYFYEVLRTPSPRVAGVVHRKLYSYDPQLARLVDFTAMVLRLGHVTWEEAYRRALDWLKECAQP